MPLEAFTGGVRVHAQLTTGTMRGWGVRAPAVVVQGMGDLVAQQAIEGRGWEHDWHRTARIAMFGFAISVRAAAHAQAPTVLGPNGCVHRPPPELR